ncbi:MAG: hypothetical protein ACOX8V_05275 [Thermoleophilia bacterium]
MAIRVSYAVILARPAEGDGWRRATGAAGRGTLTVRLATLQRCSTAVPGRYMKTTGKA